MANQKYKVAFFGAPGAGKTVFLGSYFNLVTNLGQGRPVSFKSAAAARATDRIIETLFKRQVPVQNKLNAGEVSYSVDSFNMDVQLFQTPGGTCGGSYEWEASPILTELESADGALFLISAEDLVKRPEKALQENRTFIKALSFLFESKGSKWGKEETPVVFLFTKGDAVPEATAEALAEKMTGLFAPELDEESPLADYL
ncbi:MAG: GTPase domain-containing protein, partial [Synergistaceae bacterium]|nr:GTPase domain-containing protein [Synergistaceae bacterium]